MPLWPNWIRHGSSKSASGSSSLSRGANFSINKGPWCNGNIADSKSVDLGSSPRGSAKFKQLLEISVMVSTRHFDCRSKGSNPLFPANFQRNPNEFKSHTFCKI